jgi:hypothetical protein
MPVDSNEVGTTNHPGGINISVPDLSVARPVGTLVFYQGQLWQSTNATTPSYAPASPTSAGLGDINNGDTVPADASGTYTLNIGAGAETATLSDPQANGQELVIGVAVTAGGTLALSTTGSFLNKAGNTTMTFGAGDSVKLQSLATGFGFRWQIVYSDAPVLS